MTPLIALFVIGVLSAMVTTVFAQVPSGQRQYEAPALDCSPWRHHSRALSSGAVSPASLIPWLMPTNGTKVTTWSACPQLHISRPPGARRGGDLLACLRLGLMATHGLPRRPYRHPGPQIGL